MSSKNASCFYTILGVNPSASEDVIRKAYKKRVLEWHPDKNLNNPAAESLFKILQKAYETLTDKQAKEKYDAKQHCFYYVLSVHNVEYVITTVWL